MVSLNIPKKPRELQECDTIRVLGLLQPKRDLAERDGFDDNARKSQPTFSVDTGDGIQPLTHIDILDDCDHAIISQQAVNLINNLPSRISHITVFISVILIIILIMVATHVTRFIKGMRGGTHSSSDVTPSAIVIQPKKNLKDKMKKRKRTSLACKHRSNYNLPSKTMMIQIEVNKEQLAEDARKKREKEKEAAAINPAVASVNLSAPPDYSALMV
ncbi:hypothetical protein Q1695_011123 [Nippostrongylus brasiliensis]|nr:hypothetical protein Q1695_011123 [Nippostrongylus brasiliensis]